MEPLGDQQDQSNIYTGVIPCSLMRKVMCWRQLADIFFHKPGQEYCTDVNLNQCVKAVTLKLFNPNTIKSYKILQKLSPKHAAHGVAQSPYPIYRHGKACLSKQPPWRAAPDLRLARGRSRIRAPGPVGALRALFFLHPPFLPPSGDSFICTFPIKPTKVLGLRKSLSLLPDNTFRYSFAISYTNRGWE